MIKQFQKENRWLSNFAPCTIILDDITYRSVEHAYMSAKSDDIKWKHFCRDTYKPGDVKKESKKIKLRNDWDNIKVDVMRRCIDQKFDQEPYRSKLINTEDQYIQEGNFWGDKFWGVCMKTGVGDNVLGKLIMDKRNKLKGE